MTAASRTDTVEGTLEGKSAMVTTGVSLSRKRQNLTVLALVIATMTTATFWLATSGVLALPQAPTPSGVGANGILATFTPLSSTVTVPQGQGAQVVNGVLLGKVKVAAGFASRLRVDFAWLDPKDAGAVLNNPNAWMTFGLYYPIHLGSCTGSGEPSGSQTMVDGTTTLCAAPNTQGSGPLTYKGQLTINTTMLSGSILETAVDPASAPTCGSTGSNWCIPSGVGLGLNQNVFYITSSVNTPGGTPSGQQSQLTTLSFYIGARTV